MKKIWLINTLLCLIIIAGCAPKSKKKKTPPGVIGMEKMAEILADIHIVEGKMAGEKLYPDSLDVIVPSYYNEVFQKYNISGQQYRESMKFYIDNPDYMIELYDPILVKLNAKEGKSWK